MATLHEIEGRKIIFAKGAPEKIIHFSMLDEPDPAFENRLAQVAGNLADQGLRVLGMAYKEVDAETTKISQVDVESGLVEIKKSGESLQGEEKPGFLLDILEKGGLLEHLRQTVLRKE